MVLFVQISRSQTVTPELINFTQLANLEKSHPELFNKCAACKEKENDAEWKDLYHDMPIPAGAIIKTQQQDNTRNVNAKAVYRCLNKNFGNNSSIKR